MCVVARGGPERQSRAAGAIDCTGNSVMQQPSARADESGSDAIWELQQYPSCGLQAAGFRTTCWSLLTDETDHPSSSHGVGVKMGCDEGVEKQKKGREHEARVSSYLEMFASTAVLAVEGGRSD